MQAADAGMAVIACLRVVVPDNAVKAADKLTQFLGVHRRVFYKGNRLSIAVGAHQQPKAALADVPNHVLIGPFQQIDAGIAQPPMGHILLQVIHLSRQLRHGLAIELDQQNRPRVAFQKCQVPGLADRLPGAVQDHLIQDFHRRRVVFQDFYGSFAGLKNIGEVQHGQGGHCGSGHQVHLGLGYHTQGAFGTNHHFGQVDRLFSQKGVQVIAADSPHNFGVAGLNFRQVFPGNLQNAPVNVRLQPIPIEFTLQFVRRQRSKVGPGRIGQHHVHFLDVVEGLAVNHRVGAASVIADAAANASPVRGGRIRSILQVILSKVAVELVQDNAGLHPRPLLLPINLHYLIQVFAKIHNDCMIDRLPGQAGTTGSGQHRHSIVPGDLGYRQHILNAAGNYNTYRFHLIDAGVGTVEHTGKGVEAHLAGDAFA